MNVSGGTVGLAASEQELLLSVSCDTLRDDSGSRRPAANCLMGPNERKTHSACPGRKTHTQTINPPIYILNRRVGAECVQRAYVQPAGVSMRGACWVKQIPVTCD